VAPLTTHDFPAGTVLVEQRGDLRLRHSVPIQAVAFTASGTLISATSTHLSMWEPQSGRRVRNLTLRLSNASSVSICTSASLVAVANGVFSRFDLVDLGPGGKQRSRWTPEPVKLVSLSPVGDRVVCATRNKLFLYETGGRGRLLAQLGLLRTPNVLSWSPEGSLLFVGNGGRSFLLYGRDLTYAQTGLRQSDAAAWSPAGYYLASASSRYGLRVFALRANRLVEERSFACIDAVAGLAWSPDERLIAAGFQEQGLGIFDRTQKGKEHKELLSAGTRVVTAFSGGGRHLVAGNFERELLQWSAAGWTPRIPPRCQQGFGGYDDLVVSPSGKRLCGRRGDSVSLLDPRGDVLRTFTPKVGLRVADFGFAGQHVFASDGAVVRAWGPSGEQVVTSPAGTREAGLSDLVCAGSEDRVLLVDDLGRVEVLDLRTREVIYERLADRRFALRGFAAIDPRGRWLAIGQGSGLLFVDLVAKKERDTDLHGYLRHLAFGPRGLLLIVLSDRSLLVDAESGRVEQTITIKARYVGAVAFDSRGSRLALSTENGSLSLIDLGIARAGTFARRIRLASDWAEGLRFDRAGRLEVYSARGEFLRLGLPK
jgi:WD40 repeat protein